MTTMPASLPAFLDIVEALIEGVEFDDGGRMIGMVRVGGNGGLLSNETLAKAGVARLALGEVRAEIANLHPSEVRE